MVNLIERKPFTDTEISGPKNVMGYPERSDVPHTSTDVFTSTAPAGHKKKLGGNSRQNKSISPS